MFHWQFITMVPPGSIGNPDDGDEDCSLAIYMTLPAAVPADETQVIAQDTPGAPRGNPVGKVNGWNAVSPGAPGATNAQLG